MRQWPRGRDAFCGRATPGSSGTRRVPSGDCSFAVGRRYFHISAIGLFRLGRICRMRFALPAGTRVAGGGGAPTSSVSLRIRRTRLLRSPDVAVVRSCTCPFCRCVGATRSEGTRTAFLGISVRPSGIDDTAGSGAKSHACGTFSLRRRLTLSGRSCFVPCRCLMAAMVSWAVLGTAGAVENSWAALAPA